MIYSVFMVQAWTFAHEAPDDFLVVAKDPAEAIAMVLAQPSYFGPPKTHCDRLEMKDDGPSRIVWKSGD